MKIKICLAQMEVKPGLPQVNTAKMLEMIAKAKSDGAEIICFPELCISGYMIGDIWERTSFLNECIACGDRIRQAAEGIVIVWGNIDVDFNRKNEDGRVRKYNACFVAEDGLLKLNDAFDFTAKKTLMPEYREFEDNRHFYSYRKLIQDDFIPIEEAYAPYHLKNGVRIGCILCEDGWDTDYSMSPINLLAHKSDILINVSCSPFTDGKNSKRNRLFSARCKQYSKPMVYVNCVGIQDNGKTVYTFDGKSCIYDKVGNQLDIRYSFEEACQIFEIDTDAEFGKMIGFRDDTEKLYNAIKYGTQKFMERFGINKVVIGASGGIDSAVVAVIMSQILPKENILLVNMPSRYNSDLTKNAAKKLAENIGCKYIVTPIEKSVDLTDSQIIFDLGKTVERGIDKNGIPCAVETYHHEGLTSFMLENVQARDRSSRVLAAWAAAFKGVFTCNANKSEMTVGYTTLYGDLSGFLAPIADLWKTQVYELAKYLNCHLGGIIPQESIDVVPSAELSNDQDVTKGKGDPIRYFYHDCLFASWVERWDRATPEDILTWHMNGTLEKEIGYYGKIKDLFADDISFVNDVERWWNCYQGLAVAKRIQAPPVLAISRRSFGFDHREAQIGVTYTAKYYELKNKLLKE